MKKVILRKLLVLLAAITIPAHAAGTLIVVSNNSDVQRHELIELNLDALRKHAGLAESETFLIKNTLGQELPYQLSHDGQLLMEVSVQPHAKATYQPKSVIRDSFLLFLMTAIRKFQSYLSDCQQFTIFTTQKKSYSYDA